MNSHFGPCSKPYQTKRNLWSLQRNPPKLSLSIKLSILFLAPFITHKHLGLLDNIHITQQGFTQAIILRQDPPLPLHQHRFIHAINIYDAQTPFVSSICKLYSNLPNVYNFFSQSLSTRTYFGFSQFLVSLASGLYRTKKYTHE